MGVQGPSALKRRKEHRLVYQMIQEADVTIEVLDARFPQRCRSSIIESAIVNKFKKPLLLCINKSDLVAKEIALKWKKIFIKELPTIHISARDRNGTNILRQAIFRISPFKPTPENPLTISIVGYPNVGKSSLINVLAGRKSAPVSSTAGFTRTIRRVKIIPKVYLIDTPGISPVEQLKLPEKVFLGAISAEDLIDPDLIVEYFLQQAIKFHQQNSWEEYLKTSIAQPLEDILTFVAKSRGFIQKGNIPKLDEAARVIIRDFNKGKISYFEDPSYYS